MTEDSMTNLFLERLAYLMKKNNVNQVELSAVLGLDRSTVNKWFIRKAIPRTGIIEKLCQYFGVQKSFFLDETTPLDKRAYYFDEQTAANAQYMHDNPDYKVMFDALRKMKPESVEEVKKFIDYQKSKENHDDDNI